MPRLKPSPHFTRMPVFQHYEFLEETIIKIVQIVYSHHIYITLYEELYWKTVVPGDPAAILSSAKPEDP